MTVDRKRLRDLALAATPGPWGSFYKQKYGEWHVSVPIGGSSMRWALFDDGCRTERPQQDAEFIAAANPQTILALLDALDAAEQPAPDDARPSTPPTDGAV